MEAKSRIALRPLELLHCELNALSIRDFKLDMGYRSINGPASLPERACNESQATAPTSSPRSPRRSGATIWPDERLNREIRRRTDVVGIFPDPDSLIRLVGAVLAEQHDECAERRRYLGLDVLARSQTVESSPAEEVTDQLTIQAITA
jgi:hypothetical protein